MPIDNLKPGIESMRNALISTDTKRKTWNDTVVPLLKETFQKVIDKYYLGWSIEVKSERRNAGIINLSAGKVDSGISDMGIDGLKVYEKFSGALSFVQLYNGDVEIRILLPYIRKIAGAENNYTTVRKVAPEDIDEEFVYVQTGKFVTEITAWESGTSEEKLG